MGDNTTPHIAKDYDTKIEKTIPFYSSFHNETLELIEVINSNPNTWLDTGCGTGMLVSRAVTCFKNTYFVLADPSEAMINIAKEKFSEERNLNLEYLLAGTQDIDYPQESFEVITAIQSHHYLDFDTRVKATANSFRMLRNGGIYITFENVKPNTEKAIGISLQRWKQYQQRQGKSLDEVAAHIKRFGVEYFPLTISEHIALLNNSGFSTVEIFWFSNMQAGFDAIK
jgi:tRNA (cmo5U34)-methyltransferase